MNSHKIINDPVHGFITIPGDLIFEIIEHPYFQRLRRIKQLGLTDMVYPGALHTRFHHALGAMHLMSITLDHLRNKGEEISGEEYEATLIAILLHDIGHAPFSHALEFTLLRNIRHESISLLFFDAINRQFDHRLDLAIEILTGKYSRKFFHQLVSSQLDVDRLDYLQRDSFFTGVLEGIIGADRIIKMLNVKNDSLVVEEKGIYSIENFLSARRLMYWQVYLHKTTVSAEKMLINLVRRAKDLEQSGVRLPGSEALLYFLRHNFTLENIQNDPGLLYTYSQLDDFDIWGGIKQWQKNEDYVLRNISQMLLTRKLFKITLVNQPFDPLELEKIREKARTDLSVSEQDLDYFFSAGSISNHAYLANEKITMLTKKGELVDLAQAADLPNIKAMSKIVKKYYACHAKELTLQQH